MEQDERIRRIPIWLIGLMSAAGLAALFGSLIADVARAGRERDTAIAWRTHSYEVVIAANELQSAMQAAETGQRGFLLTGDPAFRAPYDRGRAAIDGQLEKLHARLARDPVQAGRFARIQQLATVRAARLDAGIALVEQGKPAEAVATMRKGEGRRVMEAFNAEIAALTATEARLLGERAARANQRAAEARANMIGAGMVGIMLNLVAALLGLSAYRARLEEVRRESAPRYRTPRTSLSDFPVTLPVREPEPV